jgi:hypothetical protein
MMADRPPSPSSGGFTLLETLVLVVIAMIVGGVSIALSTTAWQRRQLDLPAVTLAGWLEEISQRAQLDSRGCTITVSTGTVETGSVLAEVVPPACSVISTLLLPASGGSPRTYSVAATSDQWTVHPRMSVTTPTSGVGEIQVRFALKGVNTMRCVHIDPGFGQIQLSWITGTSDTSIKCNAFQGN